MSSQIAVAKSKPVYPSDDSDIDNTENTDQSDNDDRDDSGETNEDDDETAEDSNFYVEISLNCTKGDESSYKTLMFDFGSEENYQDNAEEGLEDVEENFNKYLEKYYPGWEYCDEWEETHIYGEDLGDYDGPVITF